MTTRREFAMLLTAAAGRPERGRILAAMQKVMGPLPRTGRGRVEWRVREEGPADGLLRSLVDYDGGDGDRVTAWLFRPLGGGRRPAVICLHQTTRIGKDEPAGLGGNPDLHYALELARAGFVTLAPDYPNFGEYKFDAYEHGYASATMKGIVNHLRGVTFLRSLRETRGRRTGAAGHSLGGHNALFLAAFDERVRAVVTSCGFTSLRRYMGGDLTGWSHKGYMPRIAERYAKDPRKMPFDFDGVLRAIAPRAVFINAPERDANFDVRGVRETVAAVRGDFEKTTQPEGYVTVRYPDTGHEFPAAVRAEAWRFLGRMLGT
jgi:acetyl esterase/lipase